MIVVFKENCDPAHNACNASFSTGHYYRVSKFDLCHEICNDGPSDKKIVGLLLTDINTGYSNHVTNSIFRGLLKRGIMKIVTNLKEQ